MDSIEIGELVARCVAGDDEAKAQFFAEYNGLVHRAVAGKLAQVTAPPLLRSDVEDICSSVFERVLSDNCHALARLRNARSLNAWIVTVAQNGVMDYIRKWSSRMRVDAIIAKEEEEVYVPSPAEKVIAQERKARLNDRLAELGAEDRLALELYFLHGLKYAEIAEVTGRNINTVSARIRRAKAKLRDLYGEDRSEIT